jgi:hypothetical protein
VTEATPSYDVRGTLEVQNEQATGWCWSRQRPGEALRVEVLSDGQVVAQGIAARLVLELVRPGMTDGYHGYLLILPEDLPQTAILEAREARTGKVFARRLPRTLPDVTAWQQRVAQLNSVIAQSHDKLDESNSGEARWSTAWDVSGMLLNRQLPEKGRFGPAAGLALRPFAKPLWTLILDLPRADLGTAEATARREVAQLAPLLASTQAELIVIDDGCAAGFLTSVAGLRYAAVPPGAGDVERLTTGLSAARGSHLAIFAPVRASIAPRCLTSDTLRTRATLLADSPANGVTVGGGAAAAVRGAGLHDLLPLVEHGTKTGLLLMAPRAVYETVGALDPVLDDGAELALLDFALRAYAAGIAVRILEDTLPHQTTARDPIAPRRAFIRRLA